MRNLAREATIAALRAGRPGLLVRGPFELKVNPERRGFATGALQPVSVTPQLADASGLEKFRIGEQMSAATLSAFASLSSLATGNPVPWVEAFNLAYLWSTAGKAKPATQVISGTLNGRPYSVKRLVRSYF